MRTTPAVEAIEDWLIREALGDPDLAAMFGSFCDRIAAAGIPVSRAMLTWATLHPLIEAESALWRDGSTERAQYLHEEEETEDWLQSPVRAVLVSREPRLRRRLDGGNLAPDDFPILTSLRADGFTDYLVLATGFRLPTIRDMPGTGIIVTWATRAPGGFSDTAIDHLEYLQVRLALAARATIQARIATTLADTYLGRRAGRQVLAGTIRHGDGETLDAVIFYSDLRGSTALAESLPREAYLALLNAYFDAAAGAVIAAGGDVLDFIGDAVLGVFPIEAEGLAAATERAVGAAQAALARLAAAGQRVGQPLRCGIALSCGSVMFGNIGISDRMTFSVIGPTVNAAARIEALTKSLECTLLVTADIAAARPGAFESRGRFALAGFGDEVELFTPRAADAGPAPDHLAAGEVPAA